MTPQLGRLLAAAVTLATARPRRTLWIASVLVAASALTASWGMTVKTSNLDLVDPDLPEVRRFREFAHEFGTPNFLAVVFEGDSGAHFGEAVDRVAPRLLAVPGVRSVMSRSPQDEALLALTGDEPYLRSDDGQLYFIFVRPEDAESRADTIAPLVEGVRAVLARSDLEELGVRAGLTGLPAYAIDDRDVIRNDISRLSLWSFVLILALFGTAFGTVRRPLLAMAALVAAVTVVLGLAAIYPGHLTLLSAFFASILFGLGVDYGIHVVDRIEEHVAEGSSERAAVVDAVTALGPSLATSALTTASVFFAMQFAGFRGFAELGLIAGTGVLVCLLAMVTVLPALLVVAPPRRLRERALSDRRLGKALIALQHRPVAWLLGAAALASAGFRQRLSEPAARRLRSRSAGARHGRALQVLASIRRVRRRLTGRSRDAVGAAAGPGRGRRGAFRRRLRHALAPRGASTDPRGDPIALREPEEALRHLRLSRRRHLGSRCAR